MIVGAVLAGLVWLLLSAHTSALNATIIMLVAAGLVFAVAIRRRAPSRAPAGHSGLPRGRATGRGGRDPRDTLGQALSGLARVLVPGPAGQVYAPTHIEIIFSRNDLAALWQVMEGDYLETVALDAYLGLVEQRGATLQSSHDASVTLLGESSVPDGSFRVRQHGSASAGGAGVRPGQDGGSTLANAPTQVLGHGRRPAGPQAGRAGSGRPTSPSSPRAAPGSGSGPRPGPPFGPRQGTTPRQGPTPGPRPGPRSGSSDGPGHTRREPSGPPPLTLRTGSAVASTAASPATAGRGSACDLRLPDTETISRKHAVFTYEGGRWWVENVGRNGLCLNGQPIIGRHRLTDRDQLRWGTRADAPVSTVLLATGRPPGRPESAPSAQS